MTRTQLIRQWWYLYAELLRQPMNRLGAAAELNAHTDACEAAGIVADGRPMPRDGASDLAEQCDRLRRLR